MYVKFVARRGKGITYIWVIADTVKRGHCSYCPRRRPPRRKRRRRRRKKVEQQSEIVFLTRNYLQVVLEKIQGAVRTIYLTNYLAHVNPRKKSGVCWKILEALKERHLRGVDIRILVNGYLSNAKMKLYHKNFISHVHRMGIPYRTYRGGKCIHAKLMIFDGKEILIGSHNLTETSTKNNIDTSVLIKDEVFGERVQEFFLDLYEGNGTKKKRGGDQGVKKLIAL